jgi:hypothetical protein
MRPAELAASSRLRAAENDRVVLRVLVRADDGGLRPGQELAELTGLAASTTREALGRLVARGLARRDGKRRVWATSAGRSEAGAAARGPAVVPALGAALAVLPAEGLRAFVRLQLAAVVARWHLAGEFMSGWPGFIALGPTRTAKTWFAVFACRVFGLRARAAAPTRRHYEVGSASGFACAGAVA